MAISFVPTPYSGKFPVFWRGEAKVLPGGYLTNQSFTAGKIIPKGTLVAITPGTLEVDVIRVAKVLEGGTASAPRIKKGHAFDIGHTVTDGTNSATVAAIDSSNSAYDILTLSAAITGLAEGDIISGTYSGDANANAVVAADHVVKNAGFATLSVAYEAVILADAVPYIDCMEEDIIGFSLAYNPSIKFIKQ